MPGNTDLLVRLRAYAKDWRERAASKDVVEEAASEIERLCAELDAAKAAMCACMPEDIAHG